MRKLDKNSFSFSGTDFNGSTLTIEDINISGDVMALQWFVTKNTSGTTSGTVTLSSGSTTDENSTVDLGSVVSGGKNTFTTDSKLHTFFIKFSNVQNIRSVALHVM